MLRLLSFLVFLCQLVGRVAPRRACEAAAAAGRAYGHHGGSTLGRAVLQSRRDAGARCLAFMLAMTVGCGHRLSDGPRHGWPTGLAIPG